MTRRLSSPVTPCQARAATVVVEVAREGGLPLSDRVSVRLSGLAERDAYVSGASSRVTFSGLEAGQYAIAVAPAGDEAEFDVVGARGFTLAAGDEHAVFIELRADTGDVVAVAFDGEDLVLEPCETTAFEDEVDEDDDWEISSVEMLHYDSELEPCPIDIL